MSVNRQHLPPGQWAGARRLVKSPGRKSPAHSLSNSHSPHVLLAGFARCGTTLLATLLNDHKQVTVAGTSPPEPKVLLGERGRLSDLNLAYSQHFGEKSRHLLRVEKSTSYSDHQHIFHLAPAVLPEVKWIFVLRDPIERLLSNYRWSMRHGLENQPLEIALTRNDRPSRGLPKEPRPHDYVWRSLFGLHLTSWARYNIREQAFFLQLEKLVRDPQTVLSELATFLGLSSPIYSPKVLPVVNSTSRRVDVNSRKVLSVVAQQILEPDVEKLISVWPEIDLGLWSTWRELASGSAGLETNPLGKEPPCVC